MRYRFAAPFMLLALISLAFAGCGGGKKSSGQSGKVTVGFAAAKSGLFTIWDVPALNAARRFAAAQNAKGGLLGRKIAFVTADNKSDATLSATAGLTVLDKGAQLMVVSCDFDIGGPAAAVAQKRGVVSFSDCAGSVKFGPQGIGNLSFTGGTAGISEGPIMAEWAKKKGYKTAYVLYDPSLTYWLEFKNSFKQRFTELAGPHSILGEDTIKSGDVSVGAQINKIRALKTKPDVLFLSMQGPDFAPAYRQLRAAGLNQPVVAGVAEDGDFWKKAAGNVSNVYFTTHASIYGDDPNPKINELSKQVCPCNNSLGLEGYAIMQLWAKAVQKAGTFDGAKVAATLERLKNTPTIFGPITYTPQYHIDLYRPLRIMEIQDSKTRFLQTAVPEKVSPPRV